MTPRRVSISSSVKRRWVRNAGESAIGERIIVYGKVLDERGKGVDGVLLEFWQANAGGRYRHKREGYIAPLDPNFGGCGRTISVPRTASYCAAHGQARPLSVAERTSTTGGPRISISRCSATASRSG